MLQCRIWAGLYWPCSLLLISELKSKLAGKEGNFEQLLTLARFEEAKVRGLRDPPERGDSTNKKRGPTIKTTAKGGEASRKSDSPVNPATIATSAGFVVIGLEIVQTVDTTSH